MPNLAELRSQFATNLTRINDLSSKADRTDEETAEFRSAVTRGNELKAQIDEAKADEDAVLALRSYASQGDDWAPVIAPHNDKKNTRSGRYQYDAGKALREFVEGGMTGLEAETQQHLRNDRLNRGMSARGLILPHDAPHKRAALTTTTGAGGISPQVYPTIFDALMSAIVLADLGVNILSMDGPTKLPLASAATSYFVTEGNAPADGSPALGSLSLSLKTAAAKGVLTRQMINSSSLNTQAWSVDYLIRAVAQRVQIGFIAGSGTSGQPKGVLAYTNSTDGINEFTPATNGTTLTRANLLAMVGPVANSNAPGQAKWLTNSKVTSKLEGTPAETGYPVYCADPVARTIIGRPYLATDAVPSNLTQGSATASTSALAYGVWSESVIALFSGIDVTIGEVQDDGSVPIRVFQDMDSGLLHPAAFSIYAKGILTS